MQLTHQNSVEQIDPKKDLREKIDRILPDSLMIILAVIMVPIVVVPLFIDLPATVLQTFHFADYTILGIFVVEYFLKLAVAPDIRKHVLNPWRLLDLLVVVLPLFDLLQLVGGFGRWSPILRLLRLTRVIAVGSRAVDRKVQHHSPETATAISRTAMKVRVVDRDMGNLMEEVSL